MMNVLHITPSIGKNAHGLGQVSVNLANSQNELEINSHIWCLNTEEQIKWAIEPLGMHRDKVSAYRHNLVERLGYSRDMISASKSRDNSFDIVHQHGIWTACSYVTNQLRQHHNIPTVIAPHGSLQTWALSKSQWKKRIATIFYEKQNLYQANCLHATAESEIDDFRNYGLKNPIALIPNGISESWIQSRGDGLRFRETYSLPPNKKVLFFLSRITPKKGLPMLLQAFHKQQCQLQDWILIIAGNDEFNHLQEVKNIVQMLQLEQKVCFVSPLYDQIKRDAFDAADVFVLPSYSEGAPIVVLDSLATGVPVLTTKGTPWQALETHQCGWWVDISVEGIEQALIAISQTSSHQLNQMSINALNLIKERYLWSAQAQKTIDLYNWLLGKQSQPDFVTIK